MRTSVRTSVLALCASAALVGASASPAAAQEQRGLVNVNVGDVEVLNDASIGVAAQLAAQICGVNVGPVAVLGAAVDRSGDMETVCETDQGDVTLVQDS